MSDRCTCDPAELAAMLDFLISNLLPGQRKPFPIPAGGDSIDGIYQHHIAGTVYPEASSQGRNVSQRPWWKFW